MTALLSFLIGGALALCLMFIFAPKAAEEMFDLQGKKMAIRKTRRNWRNRK